MRVKDITNIATQYGLKHLGLNKMALIHLIQRTEGNFDCFASASKGHCDQLACLWRRDCLKQSAKNH
ncbi:MAG: hypothetical protein ACJA13_000469 [Paraglaciecola sp.]|jgi:hypothetical protein